MIAFTPRAKLVLAQAEIAFTPRAKLVLAQAELEAKKLNHSYVGSEHILLALLSFPDGNNFTSTALADTGLTYEGVLALVCSGNPFLGLSNEQDVKFNEKVTSPLPLLEAQRKFVRRLCNCIRNAPSYGLGGQEEERLVQEFASAIRPSKTGIDEVVDASPVIFTSVLINGIRHKWGHPSISHADVCKLVGKSTDYLLIGYVADKSSLNTLPVGGSLPVVDGLHIITVPIQKA